MSTYTPSEFADKAKNYVLHTVIPRIVVGGVCGAGKSSLLNAIVRGKAFEISPTTPCTRHNDKVTFDNQGCKIEFIDSPGFAEADRMIEDYEGNIRDLAAYEAHVFLLVLAAPGRALDVECKWLRYAHQEALFANVPGLVCVNKIDLIPPDRDWNPGQINLKNPGSEKERNIVQYLSYLAGLKEFRSFVAQARMLPVVAGESFDDPIQYNINLLRERIFDLLPGAAKVEFGRQAHLLKRSAEVIIKRYAVAAGAEVLLNFVGLGSDALIIIPLQIAMIVHLAKIYGVEMRTTAAVSLAGTVLTTLLGRASFEAVISFIPLLKNVVGPPIAYAFTRALGATVCELFGSEKLDASKAEIESVASRYISLMDAFKTECPSKDVLKSSPPLS